MNWLKSAASTAAKSVASAKDSGDDSQASGDKPRSSGWSMSIGSTFTALKSKLEDTLENVAGNAKPSNAFFPWSIQEEDVSAETKDQVRDNITKISLDRANFTQDPDGIENFEFDFALHFPMATATLLEDENLNYVRFRLVPKKVREEVFWKRYFCQVAKIRADAEVGPLLAILREKSVEGGEADVKVEENVTTTTSQVGGSEDQKEAEVPSSENTPAPNTIRDENPETTQTAAEIEQSIHEAVANMDFASEEFVHDDSLEQMLKAELELEDARKHFG